MVEVGKPGHVLHGLLDLGDVGLDRDGIDGLVPHRNVARCAPLRPWVAPKGTPKSTFGPGDHVVGVDIEPGTYSATSIPMTGGCVIRRVSSFDGATSSTLERIPPLGQFPTTVMVVIKPTDVGVRVSNTCTTFK